MKGSVAAFIEASKDFLSSSEDLNFRLAILLTSNEEGTSKDGFIDKIIENMFQEYEIIDSIQNASKNSTDVIIINPGPLTHTSIALRDTFLSTKRGIHYLKA